MTTAPLYSVQIGHNGQPYIECDQIGLYRLALSLSNVEHYTLDGREYIKGKPHVSYGNRGERRVHGSFNPQTFAAAVKAAGGKTRRCKGYVKVSPPAAVVAEVARLEALWQQMAAAGRTDFRAMRIEILNA